MSSVQTLIDNACAGVLSRRRLAQELGEDQAFISRVERGEKKLPPGLAARLAARAGENPVQAALRAVVDAEADANKRTELERLLLVQGWRKRLIPNRLRQLFRR